MHTSTIIHFEIEFKLMAANIGFSHSNRAKLFESRDRNLNVPANATNRRIERKMRQTGFDGQSCDFCFASPQVSKDRRRADAFWKQFHHHSRRCST